MRAVMCTRENREMMMEAEEVEGVAKVEKRSALDLDNGRNKQHQLGEI